MKRLRVKKEPEYVYSSSVNFWLSVVLFISVCCLSAWSLFLVLI